MCDLECANLIDLSLEENSIVQYLSEEPAKTGSEPLHPSSIAPTQDLPFVSPSCKKRDSLDNNPFDCIQKLVNNRQDDPFDIVEKEAYFKALHSVMPPIEVKLGNLLSLSNENLLDSDDTGQDKERGRKEPLQNFDLESESPPVTMMEKIIAPDSCSETDSNPNSSADSAASSKIKKAMEYRRRLLKLSVTNSALNSPASRRSSLDDSDNPRTPVTSLISRASQYGENMLASESPLKFVDDDIMSEETPSLLEAEKNFEADLEMLQIPMLSEIHSPASENSLLAIEKQLLDSLTDNDRPSTASNDLEAIKARLKAKREESNNIHHNDINSLICDLKSLINSGGSVDNGTKMQASTILETLSSTLSSSHLKDSSHPQQQDNLSVPEPIKRQGTFDIEIQDDEDLNKQPPVQEMPNCMISSSATYDGETPEERVELHLAEVDHHCPSEPPISETNLQSDVNEIMEQLSKLLIHNNSGDGAQNFQQNPTFIVVMNTTPMTQNNPDSVLKERSAILNSYMDNSFHDGSPDHNLSNSNVMTRRRSQSLSIHDKVKIVQLPLKPPTPPRLRNQHSIDVEDSPPVVTTPPPNDLDTPEFKTPSRRIRRNSYSTGTPFTTAVGLKKIGYSSDGKQITHIRRTQTLDTHHEGQYQQQKAIVRPMTMPHNNMQSFKPDLKKKHKSNAESIMKSSGPLKATIPVKKVAPMIKTSPPSPGQESPINGGHNTSLHKTNKIPTTPMGSSRSSKLSVGPGYPNACSTPSVTSPLKRVSAGVTKPKYSYMSATPKPTSATASSTNLKRRTISEFKVRSPLKSRVSSVGLSVAAASTSKRISGSSSRLSTSAGAKLPAKATTKLAPNTATVRPTDRFGSSRLSGVGSTVSNRNKENKRP